jgi:hypothetical protein
MALNNGAYAMSGESIKNSGVWDKLSNPQQNDSQAFFFLAH